MPPTSSDYQIRDAPRPRRGPETRGEAGRGVPGRRVALWVLVLVGVVANVATTIAGLHPAVSAAIGCATLVAIVLLVVDHAKRRR